MSVRAGTKYVGQSVRRREDARLLNGSGRFLADITLPRMLHVAFLRSSVAHARIRGVDVSRARAVPGVVEVLTGADIRPHLKPVPGMQNKPPRLWREAVEHEINIPDQPILAADKVRHVGEGLAVIVAENRYIAEDAAELIELDLEPIAPIVGIDEALRADAARVHDELKSNVVARLRVHKGNAQDALRSAPRTLRHTFYNHRYLALPMEGRGVLAEYDAGQDSITIWSSTQVVHWVRREVAARLALPEARVRCVAPDVGGGFGVKGHVYPEDVLIAFLARRLGRPVKWVEDRHEHMLNSTHARDDRHDVEIGFDEDGRILALRDRLVKDSGAYTPVGVGAPSNTIAHLMGQYRIPHFDASATIVVTNKTPNAPYRGSGRPEGVFVMERLVDLVARDLGLDPVEVRRRNMIPAHEMPFKLGIPYRDGIPVVYDSGDYPAALERAIDALGGLGRIRDEQKSAWAQGRFLGLGVGCYVEGTGAGPFEGATVRVDPSGSIYVATGACTQGQGHETVFAQVAADEWGVAPGDVTVAISDTAAIAIGYGTIASRSAVNSSSAIRLASTQLKKKVFAIAGHLLERSPDDLELRDGRVFCRAALASAASGQRGNSSKVRAPDTRPEPGSSARAALASAASGQRGNSSKVRAHSASEDARERADDTRPEPGSSARAASNLSVGLREIAAAAMPGWSDRPAGISAGLEVTEYFEPPTVTWSYATHAALVEVDVKTCAPKILKYVVVHDAGILINPQIAEGQIIGGVCQGIGGALLEEVVYDEHGNVLTGSLMDYLVPTASDMPPIEVLHSESRSPLNELGVKGLGEGGAIAPPVVIANAVCDALQPLGLELFSTPLRRSTILEAFKKAAASHSAQKI